MEKHRPSVLEDNFENPYVRERRQASVGTKPKGSSKKKTVGIPKIKSTGE